jgi:protein TonB
MVAEKEAAPTGFGVAGMEGLGGSSSGVTDSLFGGQGGPKVKAEAPKKVNISAGVAVGMLLSKTPPVYPPIAKAARVSGTVVLQAKISKTGAIEDLHVVSGPAMLQQAAIDAVKTWRYRPYLLNNDPVEVETTVNVIFTLGG